MATHMRRAGDLVERKVLKRSIGIILVATVLYCPRA